MQKITVRITQLVEMVNLSRSSIYRLVREGEFPQPIRPGMWRLADVEDWADKNTPPLSAPEKEDAKNTPPLSSNVGGSNRVE